METAQPSDQFSPFLRGFPLAGKLIEWKPSTTSPSGLDVDFPLAGKLIEWKLFAEDFSPSFVLFLPTRWEIN